MSPGSIPRIKICCIASIEEARMAIRCGASAIGLVSAMPSGPGPIPEELIHSIATSIPASTETFLLTSLKKPELIVAQYHRCSTTVIQLCDRLDLSSYRILRTELPGIKIVQVIHIEGMASVDEAKRVAPHVDALLLDSGRPSLPVKELGGTGRVHDWTISKRIRDVVSIPIFLAGGLNAQNVRDAIRAVDPFGVDVCSGVRTERNLDEAKLSQFVHAIRSSKLI